VTPEKVRNLFILLLLAWGAFLYFVLDAAWWMALVSMAGGWAGWWLGDQLQSVWEWHPAYKPGTTLQVRWVDPDSGEVIYPFTAEYVRRVVWNYHRVKVIYDPHGLLEPGEEVPAKTKELFQP
jgi:hypothetical protein